MEFSTNFVNGAQENYFDITQGRVFENEDTAALYIKGLRNTHINREALDELNGTLAVSTNREVLEFTAGGLYQGWFEMR